MSIVVIAVDHCSDGDANVFPSYGAGPQYDPAGCLLPTCARLWRHSLLADDPGEHPDASLGVPKRQRERIGRTADRRPSSSAYNHVRYHESLNNLTPADVYFGRAEAILAGYAAYGFVLLGEKFERASIIVTTNRLTHHCDIVENGDSWRCKGRDYDHTTRARLVSAIPASSDEPSATAKPRRSKVKIGAD